MNTRHEKLPASSLSTGLRFAAVVAVLGLIAVLAQPGPGLLLSSVVAGNAHAAPAVTETAAPSADYFPSHFAAPTAVSDQPATF